MRKFLITLFTTLVAFSAHADTTLGLHLGTWHDRHGYNNFNPGLYVVKDNNVVGAYHNSERGTSAYAAHVFETESRTFALTVGAVVGYKNRPVTPLVLPSIRVGTDDFSVRVTLIPAAEKHGTTAVHFSTEIHF
jgi:hypothetical protein